MNTLNNKIILIMKYLIISKKRHKKQKSIIINIVLIITSALYNLTLHYLFIILFNINMIKYSLLSAFLIFINY